MAKDRNQDLIKSGMIESINSGGAWFSTRPGSYLRIGRNDADNCLYARECVVRDGEIYGSAYTFGTDWFDISFHGRLTDIYVDPDTLTSREVIYSREQSSDPVLYLRSEDGRTENTSRLARFCAEADRELREAIASGRELNAYHIDGAGFAKDLEPSEARMGRRKSIFSLVDTSELKK